MSEKRPFEIDGDAPEYPVDQYGSVPTTRPAGIQPETVFRSGGYGVENGVPYGLQLRDERAENDARFKFLPTWRNRLGAATRRALGR